MTMLDLFETDWSSVWGNTAGHEPVGAVFTRPEIVEFILDIAGYTGRSGRLVTRSLLEPSCGDGAFLECVVQRLLNSEVDHIGAIDWDGPELATALRAADISAASVERARTVVAAQLKGAGCPDTRAVELAETWVVHTDFLLASWPRRFDFVVGNPPYVRIEDVPKPVLSRYRELYPTSTDRADLYIAFFERGLELLADSGTLAFICANRFTKNRYGEALRRYIGDRFHVRSYVNLEHTQPFLSDVSAYPAVFVIDRRRGASTRAATLSDIDPWTLEAAKHELLEAPEPAAPVHEFAAWYADGAPWITTSTTEHGFFERLRESFPLLEESGPGTRVGIGVATGADKVFILPKRRLDIEELRQIPLAMPADVANDGIRWSGHFLINPFADSDDGQLARLADYPGLSAYFHAHESDLRKRHCAKDRSATWYRTIDRIWPQWQHRPKLLIPDIQGATVIGFDEGRYYPHHNLYWISSDSWPLTALKTLLRSSFVFEQVKALSVQMRGGSVRFQAQTLRRLRIPPVRALAAAVIDNLQSLATAQNQQEIDAAAAEAYGIDLPAIFD